MPAENHASGSSIRISKLIFRKRPVDKKILIGVSEGPSHEGEAVLAESPEIITPHQLWILLINHTMSLARPNQCNAQYMAQVEIIPAPQYAMMSDDGKSLKPCRVFRFRDTSWSKQ